MNTWTATTAIALVLLLTFCAQPTSASSEAVYWPTHNWRTTTPEKQGMNSGVLADMLEFIRDRDMHIDSISIVRNGYLVMDAYFYPFPEDTKHNLRSCSKSVISALIGIAIDKGYITDTEQPIISFP